MILVDTSVWIDFIRGIANDASTALRALIVDETNLCIADVIVTELLRGVVDDADYMKIRDDLLLFPVLSSDGLASHMFAADIYRECRRRGKTVRNSEDCLIAAIAIRHNATILHNDSDFTKIGQVFPELRLADPSSYF